MQIEQFAGSVIGVSVEIFKSPVLWRSFGYTSKPTRGAFFERFVNPQKLARERFLKREFLVLALEKQTRWIRDRLEHSTAIAVVARALEILVDGLTPSDRLWNAHSFDSANAARSYYIEALSAYLSTPPRHHDEIFVRRMSGVVDGSQKGRWLVGMAQMFTALESPIPHIYANLDEVASGLELEGGVQLRDRTFLDTTEGLFSSVAEPVQQNA